MDLSVIIPVYNEEKNIDGVIEGIPSFVKEIIVVDDGSTDNTSKIASRYQVRLIKHEENLGKGEALKKGAKLSTGEVLIFIDGDGQHKPSEIHSLVEPIIKGSSDIALGYRDLKDAPLIRKFSNFMAKTAIKVFTKQEVKDPLCGFRAIKKEAFDTLQLTKDGYEFELDMVFEALKNNLKISNSQVSVDYKVGRSSITAKDNARMVLFVLKKLFFK